VPILSDFGPFQRDTPEERNIQFAALADLPAQLSISHRRRPSNPFDPEQFIAILFLTLGQTGWNTKEVTLRRKDDFKSA
jgi:hypothetical protein